MNIQKPGRAWGGCMTPLKVRAMNVHRVNMMVEVEMVRRAKEMA